MKVIIQAVELLTSFRERARTPKAEQQSMLMREELLFLTWPWHIILQGPGEAEEQLSNTEQLRPLPELSGSG